MTSPRWKPHTVRDAGRQDTRLYRLEQLRPAPPPSRVADLTDTAASNPTDGQALVYNAATALWVPRTPSGGVTMRYESFIATNSATLPLIGSGGFYFPNFSKTGGNLTLTISTTTQPNDTINFPAGLYLVSGHAQLNYPYTSNAILVSANGVNLAASSSEDITALTLQNVYTLTQWGVDILRGAVVWHAWYWFSSTGRLRTLYEGQAAGDTVVNAGLSVLQLA